MKRDRVFLKRLALNIHSELHRQHLGKPFRLARKVTFHTPNTDGWAAILGSFSGYATTAEIWIDRFTGHSTRKVYYALTSSRNDGLALLAKTAAKELGPHLSFYLRDLASETTHTCLSTRLAKARFGHPVYERYVANKEYYYGVYELDRTGLQRNESKRMVERAVTFFQTIASAVAPNHQTIPDDFPDEENRQAVTRHLRRERKDYLAIMRKQKDDYICQVCRFDFSKTYGNWGDDFAEAHHLVPLSANQKIRHSKIEDLITVCSNCHRMLHRKGGVQVTTLRKIIRSKERV